MIPNHALILSLFQGTRGSLAPLDLSDVLGDYESATQHSSDLTCPVCQQSHPPTNEEDGDDDDDGSDTVDDDDEEEGGSSSHRGRRHRRPLREYGSMLVYVATQCPICLEEVGPPVVALPCGHALCREDYKRMGGKIAGAGGTPRSGESSTVARAAAAASGDQTEEGDGEARGSRSSPPRASAARRGEPGGVAGSSGRRRRNNRRGPTTNRGRRNNTSASSATAVAERVVLPDFGGFSSSRSSSWSRNPSRGWRTGSRWDGGSGAAGGGTTPSARERWQRDDNGEEGSETDDDDENMPPLISPPDGLFSSEEEDTDTDDEIPLLQSVAEPGRPNGRGGGGGRRASDGDDGDSDSSSDSMPDLLPGIATSSSDEYESLRSDGDGNDDEEDGDSSGRGSLPSPVHAQIRSVLRNPQTFFLDESARAMQNRDGDDSDGGGSSDQERGTHIATTDDDDDDDVHNTDDDTMPPLMIPDAPSSSDEDNSVSFPLLVRPFHLNEEDGDDDDDDDDGSMPGLMDVGGGGDVRLNGPSSSSSGTGSSSSSSFSSDEEWVEDNEDSRGSSTSSSSDEGTGGAYQDSESDSDGGGSHNDSDGSDVRHAPIGMHLLTHLALASLEAAREEEAESRRRRRAEGGRGNDAVGDAGSRVGGGANRDGSAAGPRRRRYRRQNRRLRTNDVDGLVGGGEPSNDDAHRDLDSAAYAASRAAALSRAAEVPRASISEARARAIVTARESASAASARYATMSIGATSLEGMSSATGTTSLATSLNNGRRGSNRRTKRKTGGMWALVPSPEEAHEGANVCTLWYADDRELSRIWTFPARSRLHTNEAGGVWVRSPPAMVSDTDVGAAAGSERWDLWSVDHKRSVQKMARYSIRGDADIVSASGRGVWSLSRRNGYVSQGVWGREMQLTLHHFRGRRDAMSLPKTSRLFPDVTGGVWVHVWYEEEEEEEGGGNSVQRQWPPVQPGLWHVKRGEKLHLFDFPRCARFISDGQGGLWAISRPEPEGTWQLSHVHEDWHRTELPFRFPDGSRFVSDGRYGVYVHRRAGRGRWKLQHVTDERETTLCGCPRVASIIGDGVGGVWVLRRKDEGRRGNNSSRVLCHVNLDHDRTVHEVEFPHESTLCSG